MGKKRVLSGIQPTGSKHLGNYFGAIKQHIELQEQEEDSFLFIADYHALTSVNDSEALDRSDGIYHRDNGDLIAQGDLGLPVFVGTMQFGTAEVIKRAKTVVK